MTSDTTRSRRSTRASASDTTPLTPSSLRHLSHPLGTQVQCLVLYCACTCVHVRCVLEYNRKSVPTLNGGARGRHDSQRGVEGPTREEAICRHSAIVSCICLEGNQIGAAYQRSWRNRRSDPELFSKICGTRWCSVAGQPCVYVPTLKARTSGTMSSLRARASRWGDKVVRPRS